MDGFKVEHYANFGTGEVWLTRLMLGLTDLVQAVPAFAGMREAFARELGEVFESVGFAFSELVRLRKLIDERAPALETATAFAGVYGNLWTAYKDRYPALMKALGLDVGFQFQKDPQFEKAAAALLASRPELADLVDLMRRDRADFQSRLADYRNRYLE